MNVLNVGIIGTGNAARHHARALMGSDRAMCVAVLSRDLVRAAEFADKYLATADVVYYDTIDAFLAHPGLDAVIVATPDQFHAGEAWQALTAGKHVLVEKPIATSREAANTLVKLAAEKGLTLASGYHLRHHPGLQALERYVEEHKLSLVNMQAKWEIRTFTEWRITGELSPWSLLGAVGTHLIDLARWFARKEAGFIEVNHNTSPNAFESLQFFMGFDTDQTSFFTCERVAEPPKREFGMTFCDQEEYIYDVKIIDVLGASGAGSIVVGEETLVFEPISPYLAQLHDFTDAIHEGRPTLSDGVNGLRNVEALFACANGGKTPIPKGIVPKENGYCSRCTSELPIMPPSTNPIVCTGCQKEHYDNAKPVSIIFRPVITNGNELGVITVTRGPKVSRTGLKSQPGGFCMIEDIQAAALREEKEERGIDRPEDLGKLVIFAVRSTPNEREVLEIWEGPVVREADLPKATLNEEVMSYSIVTSPIETAFSIFTEELERWFKERAPILRRQYGIPEPANIS